MFNSYYHAQTQYGQAPPLASNNPFASTNPFRQSVYLPQQVSRDIYASNTGGRAHLYDHQSHPHSPPGRQPVAQRPASPDPRSGSPSASCLVHAPASFLRPAFDAAPTEPHGTPGPNYDYTASLTGQFGHLPGVHRHTSASSGRTQHALPPHLSQTPVSVFKPVAASPITPSHQSQSRPTSSSSSTHSSSTHTQSPSPWASTSKAPLHGSPASVPARLGSPSLLPLRRGSPARHVGSIREAPLRYQPTMRQSGRPGQLWMCPKDTVINYRTTWHVLRGPRTPLTCCPPCYVAYAAGGSLDFAAEEIEGTRCMFHTKRAQALLLAGDAAGLATYFETRTRVKDCPGVGAFAASAGITWYRPTNAPQNTVCCEACFEDYAKANAWATRFERVTHGVDVTRGCDFAMDSVRDGYIKLAPDHWDEWRRLVDRRSAVRPCTSVDVKAGSRKWYTVTPAITGLVICEACYLDKVTTSRFAAHFVPHTVGNPHDMYMCDFSSLYFVFPFMVADDTNAWGKFQTSASRVMDCAMAQMNGARQQFWGLGPGPRGRESDWDVCEKCYASLFEPYGFDRYLHPRPPPKVSRGAAPGVRQCDMCPGAPRKAEMLARLQEAAYSGVFSHFSDWARRATGMRHSSRTEGACYAKRASRPGEEARLYQ